MKIFFSVGEPSGDLHGANLIRRLRELEPTIQCVGLGGPKMQAAGAQLSYDLTELAVMGIKRVLLNLYTFWVLYRQAKRYFRDERPDAVVLIDYPGFNWWIAGAAKQCGIPVYYYGAPQMWAWASWRIKKMRRLVDHTLCKLPFEAVWYNERGCPAKFVGHPYYDETSERTLDAAFIRAFAAQPGPLVTLLPGSRTQEVLSNLPWILKAARLVGQQLPGTRFAVASFNDKQAAIARRMVREAEVDVEVFVGRTPELIHLAHSCIACSGSVSLELLYHEKPTVIIYYASRAVEYVVRRFLITVKYVTLVNLLADEQPFARNPRPFDPTAKDAAQVPFPEYPTSEDKSRELAQHTVQWLTRPDIYQAKVAQLAALKAKFGHAGASRRAAEYILRTLREEPVVETPTTRAA
jgi:lipid-A-disaccharide synthase